MNYDLVTTNGAATALAKDLKRCKVIAWDTETNGLDWVRGESYWHQYSEGKRAYLVDIRKVDVQTFKPVLEGKSIKIIHNSAFDAAWTAREHRIFAQNIYDTRINEQIILGVALGRGMTKQEKKLYEANYSSSLKYCLQRRGLPDKFEFEPFFKDVDPSPSQLEYMVRDVDQLHALREDQIDSINRMGLQHVSTLENAVTEVIYTMMNNGFAVDTYGWLAETAGEEEQYNAALGELKKISDINWNSWQQYYKFFGVTGTDVIEQIHSAEQFPGTKKERETKFKAVLLWKKARLHYKNVTTYGREWIAQHVVEGLVRCQYTQIVNTARLSCDNPNLQNIPSDTFHRSYMVPGHGKNNLFGIADFSGQEMAIMAVGSGEESWLECLRSGKDLHAMVAAGILEDWDSWDDKERGRQRKIVKIINFSIAYGAGVATIALRAGTTEQEITIRLAKMKRAYPALFRWLDSNGARAKRTAESFSMPPFNRYRSLALETEGWRRVNIGKNNPVQSTAADMTKLAMYYLHQEIKDGLPCLLIHQLHDELIIEFKPKDAKRCTKALVAAMDRACEEILGEPLSRPEVKVQANWDKRKE